MVLMLSSNAWFSAVCKQKYQNLIEMDSANGGRGRTEKHLVSWISHEAEIETKCVL